MLEEALRCEAAAYDAATIAATAAAGGSTGGAAVSAAQAASGKLQDYGVKLCGLCYHNVSGSYTQNRAPLVLLAVAAGPGSQVQTQLHSLLATMVKLSGRSAGLLGFESGWVYGGAAGYAASALLAGAAAGIQQQQLTGAAAPAGSTVCSDSGSSSSHAAAVAMLPSVVILGRFFMQRAEQIQEEYGCDSGLYAEQDLVDGATTDLLSVVQQWLAAGDTCDQLAAAGYASLPVLQQLQQMLEVWQALQHRPSATAEILAAAQQLQSTGLALCSFAVPCMCNNPGCTSMAGLSELAAVSGRSCICGGCRVARYCRRACQRAAWKQHKPVCAALTAAAAADGTEAGPAAPLAAEPAAQGGSS
jgi:hypothetical protein